MKLPTPTLLDRAISYMDPVRGARRLKARAMLGIAGWSGISGGAFRSARGDRTTKDWNHRLGSPDGDSIPDLAELRSQSRDLERNAPIATGAINTMVLGTVGTGLWPDPQIDAEYLGLDEESARQWEARAERIWSWWAETRACDFAGRLTFAQMQELGFRSTLLSGDVFPVRRQRAERGALLSTKVQLLEADRICNPNWQPDTDRLRGGVELDQDGRPLAYWLLNRHPADPWSFGGFEWVALRARGAVSGDLIVLHLYHQRRPEQTRGVPFLAPVIVPLKQLDRYSDAEIMAAVISSMFTVFIEQGEDTAGGGLAAIPADGSNAGTAVADSSEYKMGTGAIVDLAPGEKASFANPGRPNQVFDAFFTSFVRQIGVALDTPAEVLMKAFTASYSAARAALLDAWRVYRVRRQFLVDGFCAPCYEWVITEAVLRGHLDAPGFFDDPLARRAWLNADWVGDAPGQIDPMKEISAAKERVALTVSTIEEETAALTGGSWDRKIRQRAREQRILRDLGLAPEPVAARPVAQPASAPDQPEQDPDRPETADVA